MVIWEVMNNAQWISPSRGAYRLSMPKNGCINVLVDGASQMIGRRLAQIRIQLPIHLYPQQSPPCILPLNSELMMLVSEVEATTLIVWGG